MVRFRCSIWLLDIDFNWSRRQQALPLVYSQKNHWSKFISIVFFAFGCDSFWLRMENFDFFFCFCFWGQKSCISHSNSTCVFILFIYFLFICISQSLVKVKEIIRNDFNYLLLTLVSHIKDFFITLSFCL